MNFYSYFVNLFPPLLICYLIFAENLMTGAFGGPMISGSEHGLVESLQAIFLVLSLIVAFFTLVRYCTKFEKWQLVWIGAACGACLYVLLEEISYGQHYFEWVTPNKWTMMNDQNETNLHNTSSWLDQKPRALLELGVIVGGILWPLYKKIKTELPKFLKKIEFILPDNTVIAAAVAAIITRLYERVVDDVLGLNDSWQVFERASEVQELFFYLFILLYFMMLSKRAKSLL